jgi:predicted dehydrogenase
VKIGLVGTGFWAEHCHSVALRDSDEFEFVGVWGRTHQATQRLADLRRVRPYVSVEALYRDVDAVAFAVPPDVQVELATSAVLLGKHLLLEKPISLDYPAARALERAVRESGCSSLVFLTSRFQPDIAAWLDEARKRRWTSASGNWICAVFGAGSPYLESRWRWDKGALWDMGPHALSIVLPILGAVVGVQAVAGAGDLVHLTLTHESGATSALSLTLRAHPKAAHTDFTVWGESGCATMPRASVVAQDALVTAVSVLADMIRRAATTHPCDVAFGAELVRILATAEWLLTSRADGKTPTLAAE